MKLFLDEELTLPPEGPTDHPWDLVIGRDTCGEQDLFSQHQRARLAMAELEDIIFSAFVRAIAACFGDKK